MKYGIRTSNGTEQVGQMLPNSWHTIEACDWVEKDTELDGTCCFEIADDGEKEVARGIRAVHSFWPNAIGYILIAGSEEGDAARDGGLPEDGAILIRRAEVLMVVA